MPSGASASVQLQRRRALALCVFTTVATVFLLPYASQRGPDFPGFVVLNQTALIAAYVLGALVLFVQFRRDKTLPLLLVAGGTAYTAAIVLLQLLSFPGVVGSAPLFGAGSATTIWLWTFWHIGPPMCALAYTITITRTDQPGLIRSAPGSLVWLGASAGVALALIGAFIASQALPWLPTQVDGPNYAALLTSGVGPAVQLLTIVALIALWRATAAKPTTLDTWLCAALFLLVCDNLLTLAGGARGTLGWYSGRVEATVSAFAILWAYLVEVDAARERAEVAMEAATRSDAAFRQAQKMEAIGRLTGGIAHDFNNLLMVVISGFEMIHRRPADQKRVTKLAEAGLAASQRGAQLTKQLLTFASRQKMQPVTLDLNELLRNFEPIAQRAIGESVTLDFRLDASLGAVQSDAGEIETAILNLIVNARDALPPHGGRIVIGTRNERYDPDRKPGGLGDVPAGDYAVLWVADNGVGMDEATRAQAFEPFFTTKEFGKGSGLGLSQVWGLARSAGGGASITSTPGKGTTVAMWLPRTETAPRSAALPKPDLAHVAGAAANKTVLAVEDEPAVLASVVEKLSEIGYRVLPARDAQEALELLKKDEVIHVLFSDVVMPGGMNGVELAAAARHLRPGLPVLLTSGYTGEALAKEHAVPADVTVLSKPYRLEDLALRLSAWH